MKFWIFGITEMLQNLNNCTNIIMYTIKYEIPFQLFELIIWAFLRWIIFMGLRMLSS